MAQGVSDPSIPGTVMNASGSGVLEVLDSAGNVLIHFETLHAYSHAVLYSDRFTDGETYTVTMGGNSQSVQMTTDSTGRHGLRRRPGRIWRRAGEKRPKQCRKAEAGSAPQGSPARRPKARLPKGRAGPEKKSCNPSSVRRRNDRRAFLLCPRFSSDRQN